MYHLIALKVLIGTFFFFAICGGATVYFIERTWQWKCHNLLARACFSIIASVVLLALLGVLVALFPAHYQRLVAIFGLAIYIILGLIEIIRWGNYHQILRASAYEGIILVSYAAFCFLCLFIALSHPKLPDNLPDGAYVSKEPSRGVIIQYITGNLPTDNALPLTVAEYFLHNISFRNNHPIMPGQEVVNRPVLAALVTTPVIAAISPKFTEIENMPTFRYVGIEWPDFRILVRDPRVYAIYLSVMIALNAALLLGAAFAASAASILTFRSTLIATALFVSSPYFIFQTIFTWPKELAAFFILVALGLSFSRKSPLAVGFLIGLAYLSHPYAEVFLFGFILYYLYQNDQRNRIQAPLKLALGFMMTILPWILWAHSLHLSSDLITQNLVIPGQTHLEFLWIRLVNLLNTTLPTHLLSPNFNASEILIGSTINVAGAIGLIFYLISVYAAHDLPKSEFGKNTIIIIGIPSLLLIFIFSNQAVPALHGFQVAMPLVFFGISSWLSRRNHMLGGAAAIAQTIINITFLISYFLKIGVIAK